MTKYIVNAYCEYGGGDVDDYYFFVEAENSDLAIEKIKNSGRMLTRLGYKPVEFKYYAEEITEETHFIVNNCHWS